MSDALKHDCDALIAALREIDRRATLGEPGICAVVTKTLRDLGIARYANVSCSQCGRDFGPGDQGYSSCTDHRRKK